MHQLQSELTRCWTQDMLTYIWEGTTVDLTCYGHHLVVVVHLTEAVKFLV